VLSSLQAVTRLPGELSPPLQRGYQVQRE
jgi:hypothetical protein